MCLSHNSNHDRLVVIMLDGFRWDYAERAKDEELPNIRSKTILFSEINNIVFF